MTTDQTWTYHWTVWEYAQLDAFMTYSLRSRVSWDGAIAGAVPQACHTAG